MMITARLATLLSLAAAVVAVCAPAAHARPDITIGFDQFPTGGVPADGQRIDHEFQSRGLYFLPGGFAEAGFPPNVPPRSPSTPIVCGERPAVVASSLATSPTRALAPSLCVGGGPVEFPDNAEDILGVFTTYRSKVSLRIGPKEAVRYSPPSPPFAEIIRPWDAVMVAYDVNYNEVARDEIHLAERRDIPAGLNYTLSVRHLNGSGQPINDIAFVYIRGPYAASAQAYQKTYNYLVDDVTFDDPDSPPAANFKLGQSTSDLRVRRGATATRTFSLLRFNDSGTPIDLGVTGLPPGISASSFSPDPAPGSTSTLSLTASAGASPQDSEATVTATPQAGSGMATGRTRLVTRVVDNFTIGASAKVTVPACRKVDLGVYYNLEPGFADPISVSTSVLPSSGRQLRAEVTDGGQLFPGFPARPAASAYAAAGDRAEPATIGINAVGGGESHSAAVSVEREPMRLTGVNADTGAAKELRPGDVRIYGRSFCPNAMKVSIAGRDVPVTRVDLGALGGDDTIVVDPPRDVTSGDVVVTNTANGETQTLPNVAIPTWRNTSGFRFRNYGGFRVGFGLMDQVFGDQVHLKLSACSYFTFGLVSCGPELVTSFPSPQAVIWMLALNGLYATKATDDGHCFGMALTAAKLRAGKLSRSSFAPPGAPTTFTLGGNDRPGGALSGEIDRNHLRQFSREVAQLNFRPAMTPAQMRDAARAELARGRPPLISIHQGSLAGHVLVVYDVTDRPEGGFDLQVYDPNGPANSARNSQRPITVTREGRWSYPEFPSPWSGPMSKIFLVPVNTVPDKPEFIDSLSDVLALVSGSLESVRDEKGKEVEPRTVPVLEQGIDNGFVVLPSGGRYTLVTRPKDGPYDITVQGGGVVGRVRDVKPAGSGRAAAANPDALTFDSRQGELSLDPAAGPSPLDATLTANAGGGASRTARVKLDRDDGSRIAFDRGRNALRIKRSGPATTMALELSEVGKRSLPDAFRAGPVPIGRGQTVELRPTDWRDPQRVTMRVTAGPGKGRTRTLRDTSKAKAPVAPGKLAVRAVKGGKATVTLPVRFGQLVPGTTASVVIAVAKGKRVVARRVIPLTAPPSGQTASYSLAARGLKRGRYQVQGAVVVVTQSPEGLLDSTTKRATASFTAIK